MQLKRKNSDNLKGFVFVGVVFLLLLLNIFPFSSLIRDSLSYVFMPIQTPSISIAQSIGNSIITISEINTLKSENIDLKLKNAELESENNTIAVLLDENYLLQKELNLGGVDDSIIEAKVLGRESSGQNDYLIVNKGSENGLNNGDIVKIGNIYIGIIDSVDRNTAKVILPNNTSSFLKVFISDTSDLGLSIEELRQKYDSENVPSKLFEGVSVGSSSGIIIENISTEALIEEGDAVIVNDVKVGDFLYLGRIGEIEDIASASQKNAFVLPPVNYNELNYIFVVLK